jgi:hypothetical protein
VGTASRTTHCSRRRAVTPGHGAAKAVRGLWRRSPVCVHLEDAPMGDRGGPSLISRSAPAHARSTSDICKGGTTNG